MAKVNVFSLGGQGETGKYMYIVEVDNDILVLDCGTMIPNRALLGIDQIIPDMSYLVENKDRVKGLFISSCNHDKIGAVSELLKLIDIKIYCTNFTAFVISEMITDNKIEDKLSLLNVINENDVVIINEKLKVSFFRTTYSIPESQAICIHTEDGVIVYTGAYNLKSTFDPFYATNFQKILEVAREKVLCLMSESIGCTYLQNGDADYLLDLALDDAFSQEKRLIVSTYSKDLSHIQAVINKAIKYKRKIAIIGRKAQRVIDIGINEGYLRIPDEILMNLKFIDENNKNYSKNSVVLVAGDKHEPYYVLQRLARKRDKLIHMEKGDLVLLLTVPYAGIEKMAQTTIDYLYQVQAEVVQVPRNVLRSSHASQENVRSMYMLLKPKYIMPVMGEYRHLYAQKNVALKANYPEDRILLANLGEVITFENGVRNKETKSIATGDVLIDGSLVGDINDVVLKDREYLSDDGLLIVVVNVDARQRKILNNIEITSYGFVAEKESKEIYDEVKLIFREDIMKHFSKKYVEWNELKTDIKNDVSTFLFKKIKRRTLIIPTIIDTQSKNEIKL